jgi:ubiquinone/menaquinone biosynthesis C-methylase UbiE
MGRKLAVAVAGAAAGALWWRTHPSACPYGQRFWVEAPHPLITRGRLLETLAPLAGEEVLEVGPGTGYYTLAVARALEPGGTVHILDIQETMVHHTLTAARAEGIQNIEGWVGDARVLPYANDAFDAALIVTTLGEIPDQIAALSELRRVVRPGGRLVVGELLGDPHMVTARALEKRAAETGWQFVTRVGPRVGYFALLRNGTDAA